MLRENGALPDEDVAHGETADKALDALIAFRSRQNERERPGEEPWKASARRYTASRDAQRRDEWAAYHQAQAERHRATLRALVEHHETRAALLQAPDRKDPT